MRRFMGSSSAPARAPGGPAAANARWRGRHALAAAAVALAGLPVAVATATPASAATSTTFATPGTYTYTVPPGTAAITFDIAGSAGGVGTFGGAGGYGGRAQGFIEVQPGQALTVDVGGIGVGTYDGGPGGTSIAGFCGQALPSYNGGAGGGASDIEGVAIAGGGGGAGGDSSFGGAGGYGGLSTSAGATGYGGAGGGGGASAGSGGSGGSSTSSYSGYSASGLPGTAGSGGAGGMSADTCNFGGGGGGGGYFGGGGGGAGYGGGGGGGGSSWANPAVPSSSYPYLWTTFTSDYNANTGYVTISPLSLVSGNLVQQIIQTIVNPSSNCANFGGQAVVNNTAEGVTTFVYTYQPSSTQADICFRAQDPSQGAGYGGEVAITPTVPGGSIGIPTTDSNGSACSTTPGNRIPGSHPIDSGTIAGEPYSFDAYSDGVTTAWVCVQVGTQVDSRVIVPLSGTINVGNDVTFYPDSGTP